MKLTIEGIYSLINTVESEAVKNPFLKYSSNSII